MAGIDINNGVVNAGGMPSIFAGTTAPNVAAYSMWLDTSTSNLYYWDGTTWVGVSASPTVPPINTVLLAGNIASTNLIFPSARLYGGNALISTNQGQSIFDVNYVGQQINDGSNIRYFGFYENPTMANKPFLLYQSTTGGEISFYPPEANTSNIQAFVEASGSIYPGQTGSVKLTAGVGNISDPNITIKSTITFSTKSGSGTLGVTYQGNITVGVGVTVLALKTNNTTETSDNSDLYYQIWHTN